MSAHRVNPEAPDGHDARPTIRAGTDIQPVVDAVESVLLRAGVPKCPYQRLGGLVHIVRDGESKIKWRRRASGGLTIRPVEAAALRERLSIVARWEKYDVRKGRDMSCLPPAWVGACLEARQQWRFPALVAVIETPTLRPDGTVLEARGYDEATGFYFEPGTAAFPAVPDRPTRADAKAAVAMLQEPFADFPYKSDSDRAAAVAALLTPLVRGAFTGPTPLFAFLGNGPGTGKGKQANVVSIVVTGRPASMLACSKEPEETRKTMHSVILEGHVIACFDNAVGAFGSGPLASALTADEVAGRILGESRSASAVNMTQFMMTGNGVTFVDDTARRVVLAEIESDLERPQDRPATAFRHYPLEPWVEAHRAELVVAGLTLVRAWFVAGCPAHGRTPMASFEGWDGVVRAALIWAESADPCASRERVASSHDEDRAKLRALLSAWEATFGTGEDTATTISAAIRRADGNQDLHEALRAFCPRAKTGTLDSVAIGRRLQRELRRNVGGRRLVQTEEPTRKGVQQYFVEVVPFAGGAGGAGVTSSFARENSRLESLEEEPGTTPAPHAPPAEDEEERRAIQEEGAS